MVNYQTHLDKILSSSTEINIWRDGVISEKHYFSEDNTIKILFILREPVDLYNREDILLNYLRDGGYYRGTAPMITRLTQLIYKWNELESYKRSKTQPNCLSKQNCMGQFKEVS